MHKNVIAVKNSEGKLPDEFINIATTECDGAFGFAMAKSGGGLFHLAMKADPEMAKETTNLTQNDSQCSGNCVFFYQKTEDSTHEDDLQPHVVLRDASNQPLLVAFYDGDGWEEEFEALASSSPQKHTPEFFVNQTYLVGKVTDIHRRSTSIDETIKELKQAHNFKEISKSVRKDATTRFVITFVAANGDIFSISKNDKEKSFNWGYVSQAFGYEEKPEIVSSKPKGNSVFGTPTPDTKKVETPLPDTKPTSVPSVPPKEGDDTEEHKDMMFVPPAHIKNRSAIKDWYKLYGTTGILNTLSSTESKAKYGEWTKGQAPIKLNTQHLSKAAKLLEDNKIAEWKPIADVKPITINTTKDDAPAVIGTKFADDIPTKIMMIVPPADRQKIEVLLPRVISSRDEKGQLIIDPTKLSQYEKSIPTLAEQLGKPAGTFLPIDPEGYDLIEQINPGATKRLFFENQGIMVNLQKTVEELETKLRRMDPKSKSAFAA